MKNSKRTITVVRTERQVLSLCGLDICELLVKAGVIPANATFSRIEFSVPRGGDFSGTVIEIDDENPVCITWEIETTDNRRG